VVSNGSQNTQYARSKAFCSSHMTHAKKHVHCLPPLMLTGTVLFRAEGEATRLVDAVQSDMSSLAVGNAPAARCAAPAPIHTFVIKEASDTSVCYEPDACNNSAAACTYHIADDCCVACPSMCCSCLLRRYKRVVNALFFAGNVSPSSMVNALLLPHCYGCLRTAVAGDAAKRRGLAPNQRALQMP
jgi:hypothetical protein